MSNNKEMKDFFDSCAPTWDQNEEESEKDISLFLKKYLPVYKGSKVLDIACGTGIITKKLFDLSQVDVDAIDLSSKMIDIAKKKYFNYKQLHFYNQDFVSFSNTGYDFEVMFNAYPHFIDRGKLKSTLVRTLKPNGIFAILHNCSRKNLVSCHSGVSSNISRNLLPVDEEASFYLDLFSLVMADEGLDHYCILLKKK